MQEACPAHLQRPAVEQTDKMRQLHSELILSAHVQIWLGSAAAPKLDTLQMVSRRFYAADKVVLACSRRYPVPSVVCKLDQCHDDAIAAVGCAASSRVRQLTMRSIVQDRSRCVLLLRTKAP